MEFWCLFLPQTFRVRINLFAQRTYRSTKVFWERFQIQVSHYDWKFWDQKIRTMAGGHSPWIYTGSIDSLELPKKRILVTISDNTETRLSGILGGKSLSWTQRMGSVFFGYCCSWVLIATHVMHLGGDSGHQCCVCMCVFVSRWEGLWSILSSCSRNSRGYWNLSLKLIAHIL